LKVPKRHEVGGGESEIVATESGKGGVSQNQKKREEKGRHKGGVRIGKTKTERGFYPGTP